MPLSDLTRAFEAASAEIGSTLAVVRDERQRDREFDAKHLAHVHRSITALEAQEVEWVRQLDSFAEHMEKAMRKFCRDQRENYETAARFLADHLSHTEEPTAEVIPPKTESSPETGKVLVFDPREEPGVSNARSAG